MAGRVKLKDEDLDNNYLDDMNRALELFALMYFTSLFHLGQLILEELKHFIRPNE